MEWWRLNKREDEDVFTIEWTPSKGGIVRVKVDDTSLWRTAKCSNANYALGIADGLLKKEKIRIEDFYTK